MTDPRVQTDRLITESREWGLNNTCGPDATDQDIVDAICDVLGHNPDRIYAHARRLILDSYDEGLTAGGWNS